MRQKLVNALPMQFFNYFTAICTDLHKFYGKFMAVNCKNNLLTSGINFKNFTTANIYCGKP